MSSVSTLKSNAIKRISVAIYRLTLIMIFALCPGGVYADDLLYGYEGNVLPDDPSEGWLGGGCGVEPFLAPCSVSNQDGHFVITWVGGGDLVGYQYIISDAENQPETLWVEWNFRSDQEREQHIFADDGRFSVVYQNISERLHIFGDSVSSIVGDLLASGLNIEEFHTYRFESLDGWDYFFSVDGKIVFQDRGFQFRQAAFVQMFGHGSADGNQVNEWDFVRYGTLSDGETIVSSDPPSGFLDPLMYPELDRFTVTFDQPAYVYINEIGIEPLHRFNPVINQTRRLDNGEPETLQIVLDRPLPMDRTVRFTFDTGGTPQVVEYTYIMDGTCCLGDGSCLETTNAHCAELSGDFAAGGQCSSTKACC